MEASDDPYAVLGVSYDATDSEIKSAYRKLALRHHPDKQQGGNESDIAAATIQFAKISNAYELLSDAAQRKEYDTAAAAAQQQEWQRWQRPQSDVPQQQQTHYDPFGRPFGGSGSGGAATPGWNEDPRDAFFHSSFHRGHPFHDPFEVFERVFRHEFGNDGPGGFQDAGQRSSMFDHHDPFRHGGGGGMGSGGFMDPFGMMGGSLFGGSLFGGFPGFGGSGGTGNGIQRRDPFNDMFDSLRNGASHGGSNRNNGNSFSSYSVSSSMYGEGPGGESVTTQTTTQIVNGERRTVTERIVHKADGTVERQVMHDDNGGGIDGLAAMRGRLSDGRAAAPAPALPSPPSARRRISSARPDASVVGVSSPSPPSRSDSKRRRRHDTEHDGT